MMMMMMMMMYFVLLVYDSVSAVCTKLVQLNIELQLRVCCFVCVQRALYVLVKVK